MTEKSRKTLGKIIRHCERAINYTDGMDLPAFESDGRTIEAVVFNLSQIGELVQLVDEDVQALYPHIDWVAMRGLRNRIIHDYDSISANIIFVIVQNDLPKLVEELRAILAA